ncbi:MAG: hypothetical protein PF447_12180 [Spirochaetaceae bacterium]|nr:hypothetical protein [Spirochaetaceae bacterium]
MATSLTVLFCVLRMGQNLMDVYSLPFILYFNNQSVGITFDIETGKPIVVSTQIGTWQNRSYFD